MSGYCHEYSIEKVVSRKNETYMCLVEKLDLDVKIKKCRVTPAFLILRIGLLRT